MATQRPRKGFGLGVLPRPPVKQEGVMRWAGDVTRVLERGIQPETRLIVANLNPANVAANTTAEQTFTVATLQIGDFVAVSKPTLSAGFAVCSARVSGADTLAITFVNATAGGINPAAEDYTILVVSGNPTS